MIMITEGNKLTKPTTANLSEPDTFLCQLIFREFLQLREVRDSCLHIMEQWGGENGIILFSP